MEISLMWYRECYETGDWQIAGQIVGSAPLTRVDNSK